MEVLRVCSRAKIKWAVVLLSAQVQAAREDFKNIYELHISFRFYSLR